MALRNRIATAAVALSALACVAPVASASADPPAVSGTLSGQVGSQADILANLQAAQDAWKVDVQAGLDGILAGQQAAQGGITAGEQGAVTGANAGAALLGIPVRLSLGTNGIGIVLPLLPGR